MCKDNMLDRVLGTINSQGFSIDRVTRDTMINTIGMDSLDRIELIMAIEVEFDIEIEMEDELKWQTVDDICNYVEKWS